MDTSTDTFQILKTAIGVRKAHAVWDSPHVERYTKDDFYAFTRGDVLIALTNVHSNVFYEIETHESFKEGETLCNAFFPTDCVKVENGKVPIHLNNHETKIFVPSTGEPTMVSI